MPESIKRGTCSENLKIKHESRQTSRSTSTFAGNAGERGTWQMHGDATGQVQNTQNTNDKWPVCLQHRSQRENL